MGAFWVIRIIFLITVLLVSAAVVVLGVDYLTRFTVFDIPGVIEESIPPWAILSVVAAGLSIIFISPMLIIDFVRRGAMTSWVLVEIIVFSVLTIIWIASSALSTVGFDLSFLKTYGFAQTCQGLDSFVTDLEALAISEPETYGFLLNFDFDSFPGLCRQHQSIQALSFLAWVILLGYAITLLISAIVAISRGHPAIWTSTVRDTRFLSRQNRSNVETDLDGPMAMAQHGNDNAYYMSDHSLKQLQTPESPPMGMQQQEYFNGHNA